MKSKISLPYSTRIGNFFKDHRLSKGFSQKDLADELGVNKQFVSNWERGLCSPPMDAVKQITSLLRIPKKNVVTLFVEETEKSLKTAFRR